jgi:hypothetical protein
MHRGDAIAALPLSRFLFLDRTHGFRNGLQPGLRYRIGAKIRIVGRSLPRLRNRALDRTQALRFNDVNGSSTG